MEYLLFTYPNCSKCEDLKTYLKEIDVEVQEYTLVLKDSKLKIRKFLKVIKRDDKGAIIIPTLAIQDGGKAVAIINNREELRDWLKSKA